MDKKIKKEKEDSGSDETVDEEESMDEGEEEDEEEEGDADKGKKGDESTKKLSDDEWLDLANSIFALLRASSAYKNALFTQHLRDDAKCEDSDCIYCFLRCIVFSEINPQFQLELRKTFMQKIREKLMSGSSVPKSLPQAFFQTVVHALQDNMGDNSGFRNTFLTVLKRSVACQECEFHNIQNVTTHGVNIEPDKEIQESIRDTLNSWRTIFGQCIPSACLKCKKPIKYGDFSIHELPRCLIAFPARIQDSDKSSPAEDKVKDPVYLSPDVSMHLDTDKGVSNDYRLYGFVTGVKQDDGTIAYKTYLRQSSDCWQLVTGETTLIIPKVKVKDVSEVPLLCWENMSVQSAMPGTMGSASATISSNPNAALDRLHQGVRRMQSRNQQLSIFKDMAARDRILMIPYSQNQTYLTTVLQVLRQTLPMHVLLQQTIPCRHLYSSFSQNQQVQGNCTYCIFDSLLFKTGTTTNAVKEGFASDQFHGNRNFNTEREFDALEYFMALNFKLQVLYGSDITDSLFSIFKREETICSGDPSHTTTPKITNMLGVSFQGPQEITFSLEDAVKAFFKTEETVCAAPACGCPPALVKNKSSITSLPATLMVRIAQFNETGLKNSVSKVRIPHVLVVQSVEESITYRLYAVIGHEGPSIKAGMFSVSLMLPEGAKTNCHHLHKNTASSKNVSDQTYFEIPDSNPYMMFYQAEKEWVIPPNMKTPFYIETEIGKALPAAPSLTAAATSVSQETGAAGDDPSVMAVVSSSPAPDDDEDSGDTPVHIPMTSAPDQPGQWVVRDGQIVFIGDQYQAKPTSVTVKTEPSEDTGIPVTVKLEDEDDSNQSGEPLAKKIKVEPMD